MKYFYWGGRREIFSWNIGSATAPSHEVRCVARTIPGDISNSYRSSNAYNIWYFYSVWKHPHLPQEIVKQIQLDQIFNSTLLMFFLSTETFWPSLNSHSQPVLPSWSWCCFCQDFLVHKWAGSGRVIHPPPWLQIINKAPAPICVWVYLDYQWWHTRLLSTRPTRAKQIVWYLVCCLAQAIIISQVDP